MIDKIKNSSLLIYLIFLLASIVYLDDFIILFNESINNDFASHIIAIPFLFFYLIYRSKDNLLKSIIFQDLNEKPNKLILKDMIGILLIIFSFLLKIYGSYSFLSLNYHLLSFPIFLFGLIIFLFNFSVLRILLFPISYLLLLIPPPIELAQKIGWFLSEYSSKFSYTILKSFNIPVILIYKYGNPIIYLIKSPNELIPFAIDVGCSGIYSLFGFIIFTIFISYLIKGKIWKKILLFIIGLPIIYSLNVLRITIIIIIGYFYGINLALNVFHLLGGWVLTFLGTLILLHIVHNRFDIKIVDKSIEKCNHNYVNDFCIQCGMIKKDTERTISNKLYLKIIILFSVLLITTLFPLPVFTKSSVNVNIFNNSASSYDQYNKILPNIDGFQLNFIYRDTEFEKISGQNASLMFQYRSLESNASSIWVGVEIGSTKLCLHPWEVCLITWPQTHGSGAKVTQEDLRDIHLLENPPLSARYFAFKEMQSGRIQVILYWYTKSSFVIEDSIIEKWSKISVIQYTNSSSNIIKIENELVPISQEIAEHWTPLTNWSQMLLLFAKISTPLMGTNILLSIIFIMLYHYLDGLQVNRAKIMFEKINNSVELKIIDAIRLLYPDAKESNITSKYEEITGEKIESEILRNKLIEAENVGIIKRKLLFLNDKIYVTWINVIDRFNLFYNNKLIKRISIGSKKEI